MVVWSLFALFLSVAYTDASRRGYVKTPQRSVESGFPVGAQALCGARRAVFPLEAPPVALSDVHTSRGLVLPKYGELVIPLDATIDIYPEETDMRTENCNKGDVLYEIPKPFIWSGANNWKIIPQPDNFEAIPHSDRVPCLLDEVVFPENASFTMILPNKKQLVSSIKINGKNLTQSLWNLLTIGGGTETIQIQMPDLLDAAESSTVEISADGCPRLNSATDDWLCPCQPQAEDIGQLCTNVMCRNINCDNPVIPHGFCCPLCGGYVLLEVIGDLSISAAAHILEKTLSEYCSVTEATWTITIRQPASSSEKRRVLQVSIVEKANGAGRTCIGAIMNTVNTEYNLRVALWWDEGLPGPLYSGSTYNPWPLIVFLVLIIAIAAALWRYRSHPRIAPLTARVARLLSHTRLDGLYVRFHTLSSPGSSAYHHTEETSVLDARRDSSISYTRLSPLPSLKKREPHGSKENTLEVSEEKIPSGDAAGEVQFSGKLHHLD